MKSKYERGICVWPKCQEQRVDVLRFTRERGETPIDFTNESWILEFYCKRHGRRALKRRITRQALCERLDRKHAIV